MTKPELVLRLGTHAEKDYVEKLAAMLDGIIIGTNLLEATPGATSSLILSLCGANDVCPECDPCTCARLDRGITEPEPTKGEQMEERVTIIVNGVAWTKNPRGWGWWSREDPITGTQLFVRDPYHSDALDRIAALEAELAALRALWQESTQGTASAGGAA